MTRSHALNVVSEFRDRTVMERRGVVCGPNGVSADIPVKWVACEIFPDGCEWREVSRPRMEHSGSSTEERGELGEL